MPNDVYFQIGLITIIGLSAKNAILVVEFAKERFDNGATLIDAALHAVRQRLRPILMTSLAFGFGVLPLALSHGAGSGSQNAIGTGIVGGAITTTLLGLFFVPLYFVTVLHLFRVKPLHPPAAPERARGGRWRITGRGWRSRKSSRTCRRPALEELKDAPRPATSGRLGYLALQPDGVGPAGAAGKSLDGAGLARGRRGSARGPLEHRAHAKQARAARVVSAAGGRGGALSRLRGRAAGAHPGRGRARSVTVLDASPAQLAQDRRVAEREGLDDSHAGR